MMRKFEKMAKETGEGENKTIMITKEEKENILRGISLANSCCNDKDELVPKLFRMCGFVPVNVPILFGIVLAPPTMFNTALF